MTDPPGPPAADEPRRPDAAPASAPDAAAPGATDPPAAALPADPSAAGPAGVESDTAPAAAPAPGGPDGRLFTAPPAIAGVVPGQMPPGTHPAGGGSPAPGRRWRIWAAVVAAVMLVVVAGLAVVNVTADPAPAPTTTTPPPTQPTAAASAAPPAPVPVAAAAPRGLPTITYLGRLPAGLPRDPAPMAAELLTTVVRPARTLVVYDRPGGRPVVFLPRTIHGVPVHAPLVRRDRGWVGVLLPSGNRTIGWLPPTGWDTAAVRDQVVIHRKAHRLTWLRGGREMGAWRVSVGSSTSPTPLGRTFVFGRSALPGEVYAGLDVLALGAVPDDPDSVPPGLRGAHIGIHSWYQDTFGGDTSDGCVQVPPAGHQRLLANLAMGSGVLVLP